jgi:PAS domain S-box-containing protein
MIRWVRNTPVLHRDASGALVSYDGLISDITARRVAEEALSSSEERFRQVAENANEWIWEVDSEGLYTYASSAVEKILGYNPGEVVGKKYFYEFFAPDVKEELTKAAFEAFKRKESFRGFINPNVNKNGRIVILETSGTPILDRRGNLQGYRGVDMDITERREAEAELQKAKREIESWNAELEKRIKEKTKELEKSQAMLIQAEKLSAMGRLAGGLAHELNTPLAGLLPMLEKYREKAAGDSETYKEIDLMFKACRHMAEIVRDFTAFSRKSQDGVQALNLNELIEATLSFSVKQLVKMGIKVTTQYMENLPDVAGKTTELQQVILNMITNARDAMPGGGELRIRTGFSEDGNNVIMEFTDNGTGIEQENLNRIFDPFFTTKKTGQGVGLGLSVSYGIIKNHKGDITVESGRGRGSVFRITLPYIK